MPDRSRYVVKGRPVERLPRYELNQTAIFNGKDCIVKNRFWYTAALDEIHPGWHYVILILCEKLFVNVPEPDLS